MHSLYGVRGLQVLSDEELVRTVFKDPRLDGRPDFNLRRVFNGHGKYCVECTDGLQMLHPLLHSNKKVRSLSRKTRRGIF